MPDHPPSPTRRGWRRALPPGLLLGIALGVLAWGAFNTALEATNTEAFCIGCHEMRDNPYREYREGSRHHANASGVRATCADCHVPRAWGAKVVRKVAATREMLGTLTGVVDTPEKFEARRLLLAERVWARMKENDSLECRNCHGADAMDLARQPPRARRSHELAAKDGDTCIDCHKGVAHRKPAGMKDD